MSQQTPLVMKFGGSSLDSASAYLAVARYVALRLAELPRPSAVVVVSAMSGTTGRLRKMLDKIARPIPGEITAAMLTTGETVSAALMAAALLSVGMPSGVVSPRRTGFIAAGPSDRATLQSVCSTALNDAVARYGVAVVAGGQASDTSSETVMLGRNSSDLSGVAAAIAVGATECELFSDAPGVCSADPRLVPEATAFARIDYATMTTMSASGAKVLHHSAVDWAARHHVELHCRTLVPGAKLMTVIGEGPRVGAVIVAARSDVWQFRSPVRPALTDRLTADGYLALTVPRADCAYLVTDAPKRWAAGALTDGGGVRRPLLCALTTMHPDGRIERIVLLRAEVSAAARAAHATLYPNEVADLVVPPKRHSAHSGLLLGESDVPPAAEASPSPLA